MIAVVKDDYMQHCKAYKIDDGKSAIIGVLEFDEVDECYHGKMMDLETVPFKSIQEYVQFLASKYEVDNIQIMTDEELSILMS